MTDATFNSNFSNLASQGYLITDLFAYVDGGTSKYVATWVKKANSGYYTYTNLTAAQYNSTFSTLAAKGFQPVRFSAYPGSERHTLRGHLLRPAESLLHVLRDELRDLPEQLQHRLCKRLPTESAQRSGRNPGSHLHQVVRYANRTL